MTVIISCLTAAVSEAATYYVAKTGSNSNTCAQAQSQSTPKLTVGGGAACLSSGDTLYIKAGTYSETNNSINLPTATSWAGATTISKYGSDVVTFQSHSNPFKTFDGTMAYVIFNGFVFNGSSSTDGITIRGVHHLRYTNVELKNAGSTGVNISTGSNGNEFINCSVHGNGFAPQPLGRGAYGFYISGSNNLVDHCDVYNNGATGIMLYGNPGAVNNNTIRNNLVHDNSAFNQSYSAGFYLTSGDGNVAYNNIVYGNFGGIKAGTNSTVYNNTVYANWNWGIIIDSPASGAIIKNNIAYQNPGGNIVDTGTGTIQLNNLTTDPKFVNPSAKNFRLQTGSAAIDAGTNLLSEGLTVDFAGAARPQGCCLDIGAYEYGSQAPGPGPTAPSNLVAGP